MRNAVTFAICLLALAAGCGDNAEEFESSAYVPPSREASAVARRCDNTPDVRVREVFVDSAPAESVSLLMEGTEFRPGDDFAIAVRNDSSKPFMHGTPTSIEDARTDETVSLGRDIAYTAIGLVTQPGGVGTCVRVLIPSNADPGLYRAVLEFGNAGERLEGAFEVEGEPVVHGWEDEIDDALGRAPADTP